MILGVFFGENQVSRPNRPFLTHSVIHILKAVHLRDKMGYLELVLLHPVRRKNFAGKLDSELYNISDLIICEKVKLVF